MSDNKYTNALIHETSPYLLQHAHNPVNWYPWGKDALNKAKEENKPIIVSIGYSSCHWCHVMEHQCFENEELAALMNKHFVSIKVDREERPDIDTIYMEAVQAMGLGGGWPLNAFLTPEQLPFYGGTYFPPEKWNSVLQQIARAWKEQPQDIETTTSSFQQSFSISDIQRFGLKDDVTKYDRAQLDTMYAKLSKSFDRAEGGMDREPKFPMPSVYEFLLQYAQLNNNDEALKQVTLTLDKMSQGGLYDQIGGGFARYSTDSKWFAPHFEKMLYDNGQLLRLYSNAYAATQNIAYKDVITETVTWLEREMLSPEGGFYAALDADSEGVEGRFYVWTHNELEALDLPQKELFYDYYNIAPGGNWEEDFNILHRIMSDSDFAAHHHVDADKLAELVRQWKEILLKARDKRERPGLDDKILLGWNALTISGLCKSYISTGREQHLLLAKNCAKFIESHMTRANSGLYHNHHSGKSSQFAFLDDYAAYIESLINLYQVTFEEKWLHRAKQYADYVIENFYDDTENMFYFTDNQGEKLIARKKELFDNVIPSSNAMMARNLHQLWFYFEESSYSIISEKMVSTASKLIFGEPQWTSHWCQAYALRAVPVAEVAISGHDADKARKAFGYYYLPNTLFAGTFEGSSLPLLKGREPQENKTTIYVCFDNACRQPVYEVSEAVNQIKAS